MDELELLFRNEYPRLVRALAVACGDVEVAADAVQEAFVQANRHWRKVRSYDDPAAWLRRVALNKLSNQHRSRHRRQARIDRLGAQPAPPPHEYDPALVDLRNALRQLPEKQRLVICLHYLADVPVAEVADLLGIAPGTVKSHLHDGRQKLSRLLEVTDGR